jgi:hypothetical protein
MEFTLPIMPADHVRDISPLKLNRAIDLETKRNVVSTESMGADAVWSRLDELDREPDIEHFIEILRADGFRSRHEIQAEREALLRFLKH